MERYPRGAGYIDTAPRLWSKEVSTTKDMEMTAEFTTWVLIDTETREVYGTCDLPTIDDACVWADEFCAEAEEDGIELPASLQIEEAA